VATDAVNHGVIIESVRLARTTFAVVAPEPLRPGISVNVAVTSSSPAVGAITDDQVQFIADTGEAQTDFDPLAAGTSTISVATPAGFDTPNAQTEVTATVTAPTGGGSGGSSGGGGGGAVDLLMLLAALLANGRALRRQMALRA
jgi:hypothetical protein